MGSADEPDWASVETLRDSRAIRHRLGLANVAGAFVVALAAVVIGLPRNEGSTSALTQSVVSGTVGVAYTAAAIVAASWAGARRANRVFAWIDERRLPTVDEGRESLREPRVHANRILALWCGAAVVMLVLNLLYGNGAAFSARLALDVVLGGIASAAISYLMLEQFNRPVFGIVLRTGVLREGEFDLRRRFLLTWLLSAALPLAVMATAPVGLPRDQRAALLGSLVVLLVIGLVAGWLLTSLLARSVTRPLNLLRDAHARVRSGDLEADVAVDHGGEVGLLQAEFNHMVAGLRERARLQDLFGRHVGTLVASRALEREIRLGGERRSASVLFIDLIGSTSLTETLEPEAVVGMLNDVFGAVVRCTHSEGGWVNKFEGDAALCVFGPPSDDRDHAAAALRAALALRAEIRQLARTHAGLDAGIGVSSGEVIAGNIGAEDRYEYTVIGDPVNEAARLTEEAKSRDERVLASGAAISAAGAQTDVDWQQHGSFRLRGRTEPTEVFSPREQLPALVEGE